MKISVSITTFNEEKNIEKTLKNIKGFADEIIIIDGESKDKTVSIARKYTEKIFVVPNNLNLNVNKQIGIEKCKGDWILYLDADETLEDELKKEIKNIIGTKTEFTGFYIPRKAIVFGKWMKHGGHYPDYQLRLFKNGKGKFPITSVHDFLKVKGKLGHLKRSIIHDGHYRSLHQHMIKVNNYTTNDAEQMIKNGVKKSRINIFFMPIMLFFYNYFYRLGFIDGWYGFVLALESAHYQFVLYVKYFEMKKSG